MVSRPPVIGYYVIRYFRIIIRKTLAKVRRHILHPYSPAGKRKSIRYENNISPFGNLVRPCRSADVLGPICKVIGGRQTSTMLVKNGSEFFRKFKRVELPKEAATGGATGRFGTVTG